MRQAAVGVVLVTFAVVVLAALAKSGTAKAIDETPATTPRVKRFFIEKEVKNKNIDIIIRR
jgi:hypothetical protein